MRYFDTQTGEAYMSASPVILVHKDHPDYPGRAACCGRLHQPAPAERNCPTQECPGCHVALTANVRIWEAP